MFTIPWRLHFYGNHLIKGCIDEFDFELDLEVDLKIEVD